MKPNAFVTGDKDWPAWQLPQELSYAEAELIIKRRTAAGCDTEEVAKDPTIGVALSGGGIRSATFCLGMFQALAKKRLLKRVDYLSTVSGGGYFGSFLGRMFTREWTQRPLTKEEKKFRSSKFPPCSHRVEVAEKFVAKISAITNGTGKGIPVRCVEAALEENDTPPLIWLRECGNYITPGGTGDDLLAVSAYVRNWLSLLTIMLITALAGFLLFDTLRAALQGCDWMHWLETHLLDGVGAHLWWTPAIVLPMIFVAGGFVPLCMAYWLTQSYKPVWAGYICGCVVAFVGWFERGYISALILGVMTGLAIAYACVVQFRGQRAGEPGDPPRGVPWMRNQLLAWQRVALTATLGSFAFAVLDGWGQSSYAILSYAGSWKLAWPAVSGVVGLTALAPLVRMLALKSRGAPTKFKVPFQFLALGISLVVVVVLLTGMAFIGHGLAWRWGLAGPTSECLVNEENQEKCLMNHTNDPAYVATAAATPGGKIYLHFCVDAHSVNLTDARLIHVGPAAPDVQPRPSSNGQSDVVGLGVSFGLVALLCVCFGRTTGFLNLSSMHTLYSARLTRAYQGASSLERWTADADVEETDPEDNIDWDEYQPHTHGGPLHLVNSTLNCTESVESGTESTTTKGFNLCVGPVGTSYGQHHALFDQNSICTGQIGEPAVQRKPVYLEPLSLGDWIGTSGAAFTTGLGNVGSGTGTALGTSLICGLFNVRLGYWWHNTFSPGSWLPRLFPVQTCLLNEFTGSFHIVECDNWYLSDGGHVENTGAYELIRRRVPFIILADCGADPDGAFDDLANLTRRVRVDFEAEIEFPDQVGIEKLLGHSSDQIGTLADLGLENSFIGRTSNRIASAIQSAQTDETGPLQARRVKRYATLATVTYSTYDKIAGYSVRDKEHKTVILVLKPGLTGKESTDLINYQRNNPSFPQQPTYNQFYDEAQWESYRKLGEHAMEAVLSDAWLREKLKK